MRSHTMIRPATAWAFVGAALVVSAIGFALYSATASGDTPPRAIRVRYDDLDLSSASGIDALKHRVVRAAKKVCGNFDSPDLRSADIYRQCVTEATERALAKVGIAKSDSQSSRNGG
jgi:UrcA family protein